MAPLNPANSCPTLWMLTNSQVTSGFIPLAFIWQVHGYSGSGQKPILKLSSLRVRKGDISLLNISSDTAGNRVPPSLRKRENGRNCPQKVMFPLKQSRRPNRLESRSPLGNRPPSPASHAKGPAQPAHSKLSPTPGCGAEHYGEGTEASVSHN